MSMVKLPLAGVQQAERTCHLSQSAGIFLLHINCHVREHSTKHIEGLENFPRCIWGARGATGAKGSTRKSAPDDGETVIPGVRMLYSYTVIIPLALW